MAKKIRKTKKQMLEIITESLQEHTDANKEDDTLNNMWFSREDIMWYLEHYTIK